MDYEYNNYYQVYYFKQHVASLKTNNMLQNLQSTTEQIARNSRYWLSKHPIGSRRTYYSVIDHPPKLGPAISDAQTYPIPH